MVKFVNRMKVVLATSFAFYLKAQYYLKLIRKVVKDKYNGRTRK